MEDKREKLIGILQLFNPNMEELTEKDYVEVLAKMTKKPKQARKELEEKTIFSVQFFLVDLFMCEYWDEKYFEDTLCETCLIVKELFLPSKLVFPESFKEYKSKVETYVKNSLMEKHNQYRQKNMDMNYDKIVSINPYKDAFVQDTKNDHEKLGNDVLTEQIINQAKKVLSAKELKIFIEKCGYNEKKDMKNNAEIGAEYQLSRDDIAQNSVQIVPKLRSLKKSLEY